MMSYIRNLLIFPVIKSKLSSYLKTQKRNVLTTLNPYIEESKKSNDNSLDDLDFKKMTNYYGLAVPVMVGESFCILRGKKMTKGERLALTCLGGLTGLFDDFFDRKDMPVDYIKNLLEYPHKLTGENSNEKLILTLYLKVLENLSDPERLKRYSIKVFNAQVLSKKQRGTGLTGKEIENITFQKGGSSVLFYRCAFTEELGEVEEKLFFKLGSIWQIENDLLDVHKDDKACIKTLVTTENKIKNLRKKYVLLIDEFVALLLQTHYSTSNKRRFLDTVLLYISIGFVALDLLEKNESKTGDIFMLEKYQRKDLICDIEKPVNIIKIIHYFSKYNPKLSIK
jgi:hypothetical protein